jgi:hypothetical protein
VPNWQSVLREIEQVSSASRNPVEQVRKKYLEALQTHTGRNVITYYSGWLHAGGAYNQYHNVNDADMNSFMGCCHGLDFSKGLDLVLHTPGGDIAATESLVNYLHQMFGNNIRVIVPQLAMSAGTMIACSGKSIVMGKQSSLGPIDPQVMGLPAMLLVEEFDRAHAEVANNPQLASLWQPLISQYHPTLVAKCRLAIRMAEEMVQRWLARGMLASHGENAESEASRVCGLLSTPDETHTHSRHFSMDRCRDSGLTVEALEDDDDLQDLVLTLHHCYMYSFTHTGGKLIKVVENQNGQIFGITSQ